VEDAVKSHLMSDVPYGVLLSGGLELVAIAVFSTQRLVVINFTVHFFLCRSNNWK